ncbi:MAG: D-alanyl-D-alanine carboxypeptidase [Dehalococcoidia bacterium]|nr:MAG: D-alanyl-D-alanine carboxypeptidase [Dehalococcoidia bacterium]
MPSTACRAALSLLVATTLAVILNAGFTGLRSAESTAATLPPCGAPTVRTVAKLPGSIPQLASDELAPPVTAAAAVVMDAETGRVLYDLRGHDVMRPASTTKIMTAILALQQLPDLQRVVISDIDATTLVGSSVMGLRPGVPITIQDLLFGLMLPSGNDAAIELAKAVDGDEGRFVQRMNSLARALDLRETHFANPHGLDAPDHYMSAFDLAKLADFAMANPAFAQIVGTRDYHLAPPSDYGLHNGNSMLQSYPGADGVKIGWTEAAGWTLVASATRDGHRLIAVVLNSRDRDADASSLLDWAYRSYQWTPVSVDSHLVSSQPAGVPATEAQRLARELAICF